MFSRGVEQLIKALEDPSESKREQAADRLRQLAERGLSPTDGITLLRAATRPFPPRRYEFESTPADLVAAAERSPHPDHIPVVREIFSGLEDEDARLYALRLLTQLDDLEAAVALKELIEEHAADGLPNLELVWVKAPPRHADVFFPDLLLVARDDRYANPIYLRTLDYCHAGLLDERTLRPFAEQIVKRACELRGRLLPKQRSDPGQSYWEDDEYLGLRGDAGLVLDLLGCCGRHPDVLDELQASLEYVDPHPLCFAVLSLLKLGEAVDPAIVARVASSPEVRGTLIERLREIGREEVVPEHFKTQAALAESDMVRWLTFPTELGRPPHEIELVDVVTARSGEGEEADFYVFRFREESGSDWLAGVAGPYPVDVPPQTHGYGTFSGFEPWGERTAEEHAARIAETIESWAAFHSKKR